MLARACQVYADRLPILMIVIMHVVPPAMFAVVHGSVAFGRRGMAVFSATSLGVGSCAELLSLRTGFPFGNYHFTAVMTRGRRPAAGGRRRLLFVASCLS